MRPRKGQHRQWGRGGGKLEPRGLTRVYVELYRLVAPASYHGVIKHIGRTEESRAKNLAKKNAISEGGSKFSPKSYRHNAKGGSLISVAIVGLAETPGEKRHLIYPN